MKIYQTPDIRTAELELSGFICVSIEETGYSITVEQLDSEDEEVLAF